MSGPRGAVAPRILALAGLVAAVVTGCAAPRIVPVPAAGVEVDPSQGMARVSAEGVELVVQPSAWHGSPWDLRDYITPFLVSLTNNAAAPVEFDYTSFRLFDDARFQYTAIPPAEVERILRWRAGEGGARLAAVSSPPPVIRRRVVPEPSDWWWDRDGWWGWPWYYPGPPVVTDVYLRALPMGTLQPGARLEGFVYFPRLRDSARHLVLEFHHRLGGLPRVLALPFAVERDATKPGA